MPLHQGYSKSVVGENVSTEVRSGRSLAQAVAMALRSARAAYRARHPKGAFPKHLRMTSTHRSMRSLSPHVVVGVGDGRNRAGNLPQWTGASAVYSYLYKVLEQLGAEEWSRTRAAAKKRGRKPHGIGPTDEMKEIIEALNRGDEETLKAIQMKYKLGYNRAGGKLPAHPIGDPPAATKYTLFYVVPDESEASSSPWKIKYQGQPTEASLARTMREWKELTGSHAAAATQARVVDETGRVIAEWNVETNANRAMSARDRLFAGVFPAGISYADRAREVAGDYRKLAFLPFRTLVLEWEKSVPADLRKLIEADARGIQTRRGEQFQVSSSGQTVTLGYGSNRGSTYASK